MSVVMEFGRYQQWLTESIDRKNEKYFEIGMSDVAFINKDESHAYAFLDWESNPEKKYYFKKSPLEWRVLEELENALLVVSEYSIECKQYHEKNESVVWKNSTLRNWLNNDFYERAFNIMEKECILQKEIINEFNPVSLVKSGEATRDKIFLLSFRDVFNVKYGFDGYIGVDETRQSKNTDWAKVMGSLTNPEKGMGWWWLRNSGEDNKSAGRVDSSGAIYFQGQPVTEFGSVRPAMYLDKEKLHVLEKLS